MALPDFWAHVRAAVGWRATGFAVDYPHPDSATVEQHLRGTDHWVRARTIKGFVADEFAFLPQLERERLVNAVERFRAVVEAIPLGATPTEAQKEEAVRAVLDMNAVLAFGRYGSADAFVIGKKLEQMLAKVLPAWVRDLWFDADNDHSGDPALWIWVLVDDVAADATDFFQHSQAFRGLVAEALERLDVAHYPYVRLRTVAEQQAQDEVWAK